MSKKAPGGWDRASRVEDALVTEDEYYGEDDEEDSGQSLYS